MLKKINTLFNYLVYQIFFSFSIILALMLAITLVLLPNFDARAFSPIREDLKQYFTEESLKTQNEYNLDEVFNRGLSVISPSGFDVILLEPETGQIVGVTEKEQNFLQAFVSHANNPQTPLKRRFDHIEINGPFAVYSQDKTKVYYQYFVHVAGSQTEILNLFFDSPWLMLFILLIISIPVLLWQSHRISRPVKELRLTANAVAMGDLTENPRLETDGITEFREVGKSFNQMIHSLERLRSYQHRLISDISHELKTPLTRMQLALSLLRRRNGESSEVLRIEQEIEKLDQMIQNLLKLSRKNLNTHNQREIFCINQIWEEILDDAQFEFDASGVQLVINNHIPRPETYRINGQISLLASAVENVLRNAKKYAKSKVAITLCITEQILLIIIDDDGNGVPDDQYQEIFRPFYRIGDDRARQTGGTGLGLAIVANAVEHHHGFVDAEKSPLGGLRVNIKLPLWCN